ncbi:hypothetical protein Trco_001973 [Trichoderma cornu-damae]|uniref:Uncharacterized protein n=1 Tax=Trichoderma cornu-damae TaxID=654480 RepID=A0A9P8QU12_9HYPO|nr:hypothetical protein Trco_001973 [Trichoderma cornu-damae]
MEATSQNDDISAKSAGLGTALATPATPIPRICDDTKSEWEETNTHLPYETGSIDKPDDASVHGMDRLVHDLLAAHKSLEEERRKVAEKDAEIARLEAKVTHLLDGQKRETADAKAQGSERTSALRTTHDEEVNELRRLLEFHKTNGEQVSRRFRDLQAANKDLQASLGAAEMALQEQASLLSGLGLEPDQQRPHEMQPV